MIVLNNKFFQIAFLCSGIIICTNSFASGDQRASQLLQVQIHKSIGGYKQVEGSPPDQARAVEVSCPGGTPSDCKKFKDKCGEHKGGLSTNPDGSITCTVYP